MIHKIEIRVQGCDDSTHVKLDATDEQLRFLQDIADQTEKTATYGCMPVIKIYSRVTNAYI